ncbi:MAG: M12 family metallopeptidase [Labilithrix sp.]
MMDAIAHWTSKTNVRLVPRTSQSDYVSFHPSTGCSSMIGRQGGKQTINLVTGEGPSNVVGVAIHRSNDRVYYFYKRGFATVGSASRTDQYQSHFKYTLPGTLTPANVVEMGFASNGHLFVWYTDGTVSEGTATSFAQYAAPKPYTLAPGKTTNDVAAIGIAKNDQTHVFYKDGTFTIGTTTVTDSVAAAAPYAIPAGVTLAHVDVTQSGAFRAFYSNGRTTSGTATDLAATTALAAVSYTGHCAFGQTVHEIGHAVGLYHEQTRQDRDAYVKINYENISSGQAFNFNKYASSAGRDSGAYDYDSIMHYDSYAFSANGKPTIERVAGGLVSGQRQTLSTGDVTALLGMYPTAP